MSSRGPSATTTTAPGGRRARSAERVALGAGRADDRDLERTVQHRLRGGQRPAGEPRRPLGQRSDGRQRRLGGVAVAALAGQRVRTSTSACTIAESPDGLTRCRRGRAAARPAPRRRRRCRRSRRRRRGSGPARRRARVRARSSQTASPVAWTSDEEAGGDAAVVLQHAACRPTTPSRDTRSSRPSTQVQLGQQLAGRDRGVDVRRLAEQQPGLAEAADREPVPGRDDLVVARRPRPARARASRSRALRSRTDRAGPPGPRAAAAWRRRARRSRPRSPSSSSRRPGAVVRPEHLGQLRPASRRRTCPRRPRCRRPARTRSRPRACAARASRKSAISSRRPIAQRRCPSGRRRASSRALS